MLKPCEIALAGCERSSAAALPSPCKIVTTEAWIRHGVARARLSVRLVQYGAGVSTEESSVPTGCYQRLSVAADGGETFGPTTLSIGPWDDRLQHGGPVTALLTRAMDRLPTETEGHIARITVEILRPVVLDELTVSARVARGGRKVSLLEAQMCQRGPGGEDAVVAVARAWRLAASDTRPAHHVPDERLEPVTAEELEDPAKRISSVLNRGFVAGLTWVVRDPIGARGGPTTAWARPEMALVEGESPTDLERLAMVADCANGVGMRVDPRDWTFLNTDVTIHVHTPPRGDWVGLVAESRIGAEGAGTSTAVLHDGQGPIGRVSQALLVEAR